MVESESYCSNEVDLEKDMVEIPPGGESESGINENIANGKQECGEKIINEQIDDQDNIEDALEEPVYSGMCYISPELAELENTDGDKEFEEQDRKRHHPKR